MAIVSDWPVAVPLRWRSDIIHYCETKRSGFVIARGESEVEGNLRGLVYSLVISASGHLALVSYSTLCFTWQKVTHVL